MSDLDTARASADDTAPIKVDDRAETTERHRRPIIPHTIRILAVPIILAWVVVTVLVNVLVPTLEVVGEAHSAPMTPRPGGPVREQPNRRTGRRPIRCRRPSTTGQAPGVSLAAGCAPVPDAPAARPGTESCATTRPEAVPPGSRTPA